MSPEAKEQTDTAVKIIFAGACCIALGVVILGIEGALNYFYKGADWLEWLDFYGIFDVPWTLIAFGIFGILVGGCRIVWYSMGCGSG